MKNNKRLREKRKLIKEIIIGVIILIIIQLFIIAILLRDKYQCQQANSDNTYTETIYVDRVEYVSRTKSVSSSIYIYSDDIKWNLSPRLARERTQKSPDEICQTLEGEFLNITYKKVFTMWGWANEIVDAYDEDVVYYSIDEYNADNKIRDEQRIWMWIFFEFFYILCTLFWLLVKKYELKCFANGSKQKKLSKLRKH